MRAILNTLCTNFIENRDRIKASFPWENSYIYPVCAAVFTDKRKEADVLRMKDCMKMLRDHTGMFSGFRGTAKLAVISMLAADENPEGKMKKALQIYGYLKEHFFSSSYLPVAAMIIADLAKEEQFEEIAARTRHIYKRMKEQHPFLTSGEDSVFAALLALSPMDDETIVEETEKCFQYLQTKFFSGNAVQSVSHVLALGEGTAEEKCRRLQELYDGLKARGHKYGREYELATLGVLAMLPEETEIIIEDMIEADNFLAGQKGYGFLGMGKKQRLMHAGMLVSSSYIGETDNTAMKSAAINGTISLIAAQQAAMYAAIAASSAAAANSSSNG